MSSFIAGHHNVVSILYKYVLLRDDQKYEGRDAIKASLQVCATVPPIWVLHPFQNCPKFHSIRS